MQCAAPGSRCLRLAKEAVVLQVVVGSNGVAQGVSFLGVTVSKPAKVNARMERLIALTFETQLAVFCIGAGKPVPPKGLVCPKCVINSNGQRTCCAPGGSWYRKCGLKKKANVYHTWNEGIESCQSKFLNVELMLSRQIVQFTNVTVTHIPLLSVITTKKPVSRACAKCAPLKKTGKFSCCAPGGSWSKRCGATPNFDHSWKEGVEVCRKAGKSLSYHPQVNSKNITDPERMIGQFYVSTASVASEKCISKVGVITGLVVTMLCMSFHELL